MIGRRAAIVAVPRIPHQSFQCFLVDWRGMGFILVNSIAGGTHFSIEVIAGTLACRSARSQDREKQLRRV